MKYITKKFRWALLLLVLFGCKEFGDINIDPNNTTSVAPEALLTSSLRTINSVVSSTVGELYSQHMTETQYTEESRYQTVNFDFNGFYTGALANLDHIIELNTSEDTQGDALQSGSNANQIAVARILKVYFYHHMTDRWGPLPYSQALKGRENFKPAYDGQDAIYSDMLKELAEAVGQIDGGAGVKGDFLFNGDMSEWKKFANTIRMVIALRMSEVDAGKANSEFNAALSSGIIDSDVMYPYLAESANENPWYSRFITRTDWAITDVLADFMRDRGDPRLDNYADPAPNYGEVRGMPYGIEAAGDIPNPEISFPNSTYVKAQDAPLPIYTVAQTLFSQAEAAHRGWTGGDAKTLYEDAIRASMAQWNITDAATIDAFLQDPGVAWDENKALQLIGEQKWVALYLQGYEAWAEWRRTGWPALTPSPDPLNNSGQIPHRHGYPTSERDLNADSYNGALNLLGGSDDLDTPLWWDK